MNCCKRRARKGWWRWRPTLRNRTRARCSPSTKTFVKDHHAVAFVCDTMRMAVSGGVEVFDLDQMLEADMDVHHHEATRAGVGVEHDGGLAARAGHCGGGAGGGDHDGRAGRTSGRNWTQSGGGAGGNVSGHSAVLRAGRTAGVAHGQDGGRGTRVPAGVAGDHDCVSERRRPDHGG